MRQLLEIAEDARRAKYTVAKLGTNDKNRGLTAIADALLAHADEIIAAGLDIPMITKVMLELKKRGHDVDTSVYTVTQAMDALRACKRKEAAHEC